jgi:hypothetical protein
MNFANCLEEIIDIYIDDGKHVRKVSRKQSMDDVISALELKLMALKEEEGHA